MSMLAERKRKQKWSLNPRGKDWAQDANKFGQKMLEKMGWQQGKGLGAKGDGITEHIKVAYKNDSKGMGYKESNDQWTEHETNFTALLESLSGTVQKPEDIKVQSLEKKSESSRARVHYRKFTRGKDLSRYSEKDLANIFGKKSLKLPVEDTVKEVMDSNMDKLEKDSNFIINGGSMRDYFKKKLPIFGKSNGYVVGSNGVLKKGDSDSEVVVRPSFNCSNHSDFEESTQYIGFGFKSDRAEPEKKKKRKVDDIEEDTPKKKSKSDVNGTCKLLNGGDGGLSNPAFNPMCTPIKVEKHVLTTIEETFSEDVSESEEISVKAVEVQVDVHKMKNEINSKVKQKIKKKTSGIDNTNFEEISQDSIDNSQCQDNPFEVPIEGNKKRKKKKEKFAINNPTFDVSGEDSKTPIENIQYDNPFEVQIEKVKKKKKKEAFAIENPSFGEGPTDTVVEADENQYERKKKKKKSKLIIEHPSFNASEEISDISQDNPNELNITCKASKVPEKKKTKRKQMAATENLAFNVSLEEESTDPVLIEENSFEVKRKKRKADLMLDCPSNASIDSVKSEANSYEVKKKKKKKEKDILAIENPAFDNVTNTSTEISQTDESISDHVENTIENNVYEVTRKNKKSKKHKIDNGIANPGLDLETLPSNITDFSTTVEESDLMLNIVTTPIPTKSKTLNSNDSFSITKVNSVKRRKSVRFNDITQERIIPNNDDLRNPNDIENRNELFDINTQVLNSSLEDQAREETGLDNLAFDRQKNRIDENLDSISKTLDRYQAEIENDINEKKLENFSMDDVMVGEVGTPHGENEKTVDGTKLKFKYAHFLMTRTPSYHLDKVGPKKGYRHLIKGDIVVKFHNTNLHQINGLTEVDNLGTTMKDKGGTVLEVNKASRQ